MTLKTSEDSTDEMENKSRAFIAEISEILGLEKPIDILQLCTITELFFKPLEERIIELEKENAELKEQLGDKVMQKRKDKADLVWKLKTANEQKKSQLAEAKDLLKDIISASRYNQMGGEAYENEEYKELIAEAEHFISEVENE